MQDKGNGAFATDSIVKKYGGNAVTRWLRRLNPFATPTVATFHERTIINAATIREDGLLGDVIARHLDAGNISQEEAVRLWLIMHRAMGAHSPYHAYLQSLPAAFSTPMHYSESELAELAGTPLFYAAQVRRTACVHCLCIQLLACLHHIVHCAGHVLTGTIAFRKHARTQQSRYHARMCAGTKRASAIFVGGRTARATRAAGALRAALDHGQPPLHCG